MSFSLNDFNLDQVVKINATTTQPSGNICSIPYYLSSGDFATFYIRANKVDFVCRSGSSYGGGTWRIIMEYTKTTN